MTRRAGVHRPHYGASAYARIPNDAYFTVDDRVVPCLTSAVQLRGKLHEPACGAFHLVRALRRAGYQQIECSDIVQYVAGRMRLFDFLELQAPLSGVQTIVFNPPNKLSVQFVEHALRLMRAVRGMVAALVPYAWDTAPGRRWMFNEAPLRCRISLPFRPWWSETERIATPREDWMWLVWDWRHRGPASAVYA